MEQQPASGDRWIKMLVSIAIGVGLGYLYWKLTACNTGTCPLSSNPYLPTTLGGLMGLAAGWPYKPQLPPNDPGDDDLDG